MKYDPSNELTQEQLDKIAEENFDDFLEYLDSQAEYLKQFSKPLSSYHTKRYASLSAAEQGKKLTDEEFNSATKLGTENEEKAKEVVKDKIGDYKKKSHDILKNNGVKNVKTNRGQWFD